MEWAEEKDWVLLLGIKQKEYCAFDPKKRESNCHLFASGKLFDRV